MTFKSSHDVHTDIELARLEARLRTAWQDDFGLQSRRLASELSLATAQIMAWIAVVATVLVMFVLLLLTPRRATPRPAPGGAVVAVETAGPPAAPILETEGVRRSPRPAHPRSAVAGEPAVADVHSLERRLIPWMLVFWGTGILALAGTTLAIVKR